MTEILFKNAVRILRPDELKKLMDAIPKAIDRMKFEAMFYTGCRYVEMKLLLKHPEFLIDNSIKMNTNKKRSTVKERYIRLNENGVRAVKILLKQNARMPETTGGWNRNLKRWGKLAGIDPSYLCAKTTRKTWESYLVMSYMHSLEFIFLSQGHSQMTSLRHYLMLPFTDKEKEQIKYYTQGWI